VLVEAYKVLTTKTSEEVQLAANQFTALTKFNASNQTGINYTATNSVSYADDETELVGLDNHIILDNIPVTQSEFFGVYNNVSGVKIPSTDYSVDYSEGNVTFIAKYNLTNVTAVYSYGGSIQVAGEKTLSNICVLCLFSIETRNSTHTFMKALSVKSFKLIPVILKNLSVAN